jgi:ATP-dependent DNA helicase DinG
LIEAAHGHTLVLFTSYRVMELAYLRLKGSFVFPFMKVGRGVVNVIEQFRESKNGVLFAAGSFWEGVDLPGDILSSLVVVKLPFPQPDPLADYERSQYESDSEYIENALIPQMLVKLKQGAGRLIRNEADTGVISILDSRLRRGGKYRKDVLRTLPKCGIADNVFDIEQFIREKKPAEYFGKGA